MDSTNYNEIQRIAIKFFKKYVETHTVAMTDPQLTNNNNNNDGEPKYLHKKFKKMASTEVSQNVETRKETSTEVVVPPSESEKKKEIAAKGESAESEPAATAEVKKSGYVCSYCKLSCAKPSVLQKHIRAHTNERPYPCVPCGFAFKTKSNLYKHCRSRSHSLKLEGQGSEVNKVSEDSDISLSDSASNGTGTPPPPPASSSSTSSIKTVKTGKIYKPKFHTALHNASNETETSSNSSSSSSCSSTNMTPNHNNNNNNNNVKPNAERLQEHIDKIISDNQVIVESVDPRLHKLMQRQQSLVEIKQTEQPLNLSSGDESTIRKRCYSDSFAQEGNKDVSPNADSSIIKDLLLKTAAIRSSSNHEENNTEADNNFVCQFCKISYTSADNLEAHKKFYCKGVMSPRRADFQLDLDKRDTTAEYDSKVDYYNLQPLQSPGPLLGNTRLVDAYTPPAKKSRNEPMPGTLRSLEELSKFPRPNSLQMFGGEVRILDNTGETKTMRIEPRKTSSPTSEHIVTNKCATSETSSIVVRSGLHSGGTMVHKPPGGSTPDNSTPNSSISLPDNSKLLAPIVPNISTTNLAPTMTCYNYLEPHLNPLTNITAYNPLTLPQAGIASILHGGKVIPYVPGMPGPHTLTNSSPSVDISPSSIPPGDATYKVIPGMPGLHMIPQQPLNLASPVKILTQNVPGIPGPPSSLDSSLNQPLDLASPANKSSSSSSNFKTPDHGHRHIVTKISSIKSDTEKYKTGKSISVNDLKDDDRLMKNSTITNKTKDGDAVFESNPKIDKVFNYSSSRFEDDKSPNSYSKMRFSPKLIENRKRHSTWNVEDLEERVSDRNSFDINSLPFSEQRAKTLRQSPVLKLDSSLPNENGRLKLNGAKVKPETSIFVNLDSSKTEVRNKSPVELIGKIDGNKSPWNYNDDNEEASNTKFLRPTSLPLKPGTFTPKKHHGITPTANTLPLISPETPRQRKSYGQVFFNGHAYTYLGLKCSTRLYYCTLNRPQPMYVMQQHNLSMYSNWKICKDAPPDVDMAHYDSRHRPLNYSIASTKQEDIMTHSSRRPTTPISADSGLENDTQEKAKRVKIFDGGFESNEDYTYVRGRGRGRYVCEECGIRCKKPSMLKKHIRTHTDVRPYTCKHCSFSFKTKGNLTKHMKSKAHYKKCVELGIVPVPTVVCDENIDKEAIARLTAGGGNAEESSSEDEETEGDDSEESGSEEQEAAQSLLSLSQRSSSGRLPGLLPSGRPTTYPYLQTLPTASVTTSVISTTVVSSISNSIMSQATTSSVIHNELSNRYYFPSNRSTSSEESSSRSSVIQSSIKNESDMEMETVTDSINGGRHSSQPMDLTIKQISQSSIQRAKPMDILTPVSEPALLQTIVQSMERLPIHHHNNNHHHHGREWKPETDGHMLQAYLTERHVMDSKMKEQYRVGNCKVDNKHIKERELYLQQHNSNLSVESHGVPTVTYTDPTKLQPAVLESRIKNMSKQASEDIKHEIREKIYLNSVNVERRPFDIDSIYNKDKDLASRSSLARECFEPRIVNSIARTIDYNLMNISERSNFVVDLPIENSFIQHDVNNRHAKNEVDRNSMFNAMKMMREVERPRGENLTTQSNLDIRLSTNRSHTPDLRPTSNELRNSDLRSPNREMRNTNQDYRTGPEYKTSSLSHCHDHPRTKQEFSPPIGMEQLNVEVSRPPSRETRMIGEYRSPSDSVLQHEPSNLHQEIPRTQGAMDIRVAERFDSIELTKQSINESIKHSMQRKMVVGGPPFRIPSSTGGNSKPQAEFLQPSSGPTPNYVSVMEDGRSVCGMCNKVFSKDAKESHLRLHINIHYFERPFRCESCAIPFRTKGHLTKHQRSISHRNKVSMTSTFGAATSSNPRPFKCNDCKSAFRIHGHLAKHLRSKMHIMKLECLGKLPFGTYAEMERSGINLNDIDTTDCDNSLVSLQLLAQKLYEKDPSKMGQWDPESANNQGSNKGENSCDESEELSSHSIHSYSTSQIVSDAEASRTYHVPIHEESKSLTFKCQICSVSMQTLNELQVHCFVEHNIETDTREKDGITTTRFVDEIPIRQNDGAKKLEDI
ncbi:uncharacterized protein LOC127281465 isoform X2 [Leptopilina boulardi]|uniref:uncharacterized protein LOC127281465 isoform X2 n=1 Tax=Leptopilina boulardi TaxID=63433 RepID=UPI0021F621A1|nr:uncharacterized protein LOC127281465 isoform X2 [Leptopilina boulardi]